MTVTREKLYEEVWAEPMTTVAARYEVSSNFLARICGRLKIPTPGRGYWAMREAGKAPKQPSLPEAGPGDEFEWSRGGEARRMPLALPEPPNDAVPISQPVRKRRASHHGLVLGVREHFENAREQFGDEYPKPTKRLLVDIIVSKTGIERALQTANKVFLALEARGYRVNLAPRTQQWRRPDVDAKGRPGSVESYSRGWTPERPTVVYLGTVAVGLTLYELSEEARSAYVDGKKVRVPGSISSPRDRLLGQQYVSTAHFPTGRFALRAYSPYPETTWSKEWHETKPRELSSLLEQISQDLLAGTRAIVEQVKEAQRQAEIRRLQWEEQKRKWAIEEEERRKKEAEQRRIQARKASFEQLVSIIEDWSFARQMETFFETARENASALPEDERTAVLTRLEKAREMFGGIAPLPHFRSWKSPEER
jgi:hypothetical protein